MYPSVCDALDAEAEAADKAVHICSDRMCKEFHFVIVPRSDTSQGFLSQPKRITNKVTG